MEHAILEARPRGRRVQRELRLGMEEQWGIVGNDVFFIIIIIIVFFFGGGG